MRLRPFGGTLTLLALTACGDPYGPPRSNDPVVLVDRLQAMDSLFADRVLRVSSVLGLAFRTPPDTGIFPDSLLGLTFAWDTLAHAYARTTREGAPPSGVRYLLYQIQGAEPSRPLSEVGQTDLVAMPGAVPELHALVSGSGVYTGSGTDLRVLGSFGTAAYDIRATGTLSTTGREAPLTARFAADLETAVMDVDVGLPDRSLLVRTALVFRFFSNGSRQEVDFRVFTRGESLTMDGWVEQRSTVNGTTYAADISLFMNGALLATIIGTDAGIKFRDVQGDVLTGSLAAALNRFLHYPGTVQTQIGGLLQPSVNVLRGF